MQVPQLQISQTHGQIGMNHHRPQIQIQQHDPAFTIKQEHATIQINQQSGQLSIDQREAFASANSKHIYRLIEEWGAKAMNHARQMTAKYAQEGDQMMRIENGGDVIPRIAERNSDLLPTKEFNVVQMPRPFSVKVNYQPGQLSVNATGGMADVQVQKRDPTIQHQPWQTDAYIRQKNNIQFQAVGVNVNRGL